jgi:hypothetical protein
MSAPAKAAEFIYDALIWDDHSGFGPMPDYDLEHLEDWRQAGVNYLSRRRVRRAPLGTGDQESGCLESNHFRGVGTAQRLPADRQI